MASSRNDRYLKAADKFEGAVEGYSGKDAYERAFNQGMENSKKVNELNNAEAQKYAKQQADATAQQSQAQATTAARSAGMNKSKAAMMGSQQTANAYQNAYSNAYNNQMQNSAANMENQQQRYYSAGLDRANLYGTGMSSQQQEGQNEYNRRWGNVSAVTGIITSDEKLKHYRECSAKVVKHSPKSIQTLKWVRKEGE